MLTEYEVRRAICEIGKRLYEKGYVTYPRTNSEYLATAEQDKVKGILSEVSKLGYNVIYANKKQIENLKDEFKTKGVKFVGINTIEEVINELVK